nr:IS110 family transposase [Paenibacillus sp. OV219]
MCRISNPCPAVVLEATGHYHSPVIQFLYEHQYLYIVIISHQAKKTSLKKVKTDIADAYQLGELFYKEELEPLKKSIIQQTRRSMEGAL